MNTLLSALLDESARDGVGSAIIQTATIRVALAARSAGMEPARLTALLGRVTRESRLSGLGPWSRRALRSQLSRLAIDAYYGQAL